MLLALRRPGEEFQGVRTYVHSRPRPRLHLRTDIHAYLPFLYTPCAIVNGTPAHVLGPRAVAFERTAQVSSIRRIVVSPVALTHKSSIPTTSPSDFLLSLRYTHPN